MLRYSYSLTVFILLILPFHAHAQSPLIQNWTTEPTKKFDQQDPGTITLQVNGANHFFYVYATAISATNQAVSDFDAVAKYVPQPAITGLRIKNTADAGTCSNLVATVITDIGTMTQPQLDTSTNTYASLTLADTQKDWNAKVGAAYSALISGHPDCSKADGYSKLTAAYLLLFPNDTSAVTASVPVQACKDYTIVVNEFYHGVTTSRSITATFPASCDQLTLSAGTVATEIQNPTYNSRPSPTQSGQFLSIENTGKLRLTLAALLNYNLPGRFNAKILSPFRLSISTGPVFQNSQSATSSFGWMLGGSLSVHKRLYLTVGEHAAQFPDTPYGFTNGAAIPAGFGELTPRVRWTSRFAFGITFQTHDLSKAFGGGSATPSVTAVPKS